MKKRTILIGIASFDDVIKDTLDACKKAKRGQPLGAVNRIDFPDEATLWSTLSPKRMEVLRHLRKYGPLSGRQLARDLVSCIKHFVRFGHLAQSTDGRASV